MTPRTEAIAYRVWAYAAPRGWNVTIVEVAEEIGVEWQSVRSVMVHKKWIGRLRNGSTTQDAFTHGARFGGPMVITASEAKALAGVSVRG